MARIGATARAQKLIANGNLHVSLNVVSFCVGCDWSMNRFLACRRSRDGEGTLYSKYAFPESFPYQFVSVDKSVTMTNHESVWLQGATKRRVHIFVFLFSLSRAHIWS